MEGTNSNTLASDVASLVARLEEGRLRPVDFVGAYILRFMEHRIPQGKYLSLRNPPLKPDDTHRYPSVSLGFNRTDKEDRLEFGEEGILEKLRVSEVNGLRFTKRTTDKLKVKLSLVFVLFNTQSIIKEDNAGRRSHSGGDISNLQLKGCTAMRP